MAKNILEILRCEHHKIFIVWLALFYSMVGPFLTLYTKELTHSFPMQGVEKEYIGTNGLKVFKNAHYLGKMLISTFNFTKRKIHPKFS